MSNWGGKVAVRQTTAETLRVSEMVPLLAETGTLDSHLAKALRKLMDDFDWEEINRMLETKTGPPVP